mmetsp:Transcript_30175/g.82964  ORF Transcript_30175/g.82964 Transcript_30175/m.82964 type:complete len:186 (+) Transcript_30175:507-1064(+)
MSMRRSVARDKPLRGKPVSTQPQGTTARGARASITMAQVSTASITARDDRTSATLPPTECIGGTMCCLDQAQAISKATGVRAPGSTTSPWAVKGAAMVTRRCLRGCACIHAPAIGTGPRRCGAASASQAAVESSKLWLPGARGENGKMAHFIPEGLKSPVPTVVRWPDAALCDPPQCHRCMTTGT